MNRTLEEIDRSLRLNTQLLGVTNNTLQKKKIQKQVDALLDERFELEHGIEQSWNMGGEDAEC